MFLFWTLTSELCLRCALCWVVVAAAILARVVTTGRYAWLQTAKLSLVLLFVLGWWLCKDSGLQNTNNPAGTNSCQRSGSENGTEWQWMPSMLFFLLSCMCTWERLIILVYKSLFSYQRHTSNGKCILVGTVTLAKNSWTTIMAGRPFKPSSLSALFVSITTQTVLAAMHKALHHVLKRQKNYFQMKDEELAKSLSNARMQSIPPPTTSWG